MLTGQRLQVIGNVFIFVIVLTDYWFRCFMFVQYFATVAFGNSSLLRWPAFMLSVMRKVGCYGLFVRLPLETLLAIFNKGKGFPYSLSSVGPGVDPGVQAVSPQVTKRYSTWW